MAINDHQMTTVNDGHVDFVGVGIDGDTVRPLAGPAEVGDQPDGLNHSVRAAVNDRDTAAVSIVISMALVGHKDAIGERVDGDLAGPILHVDGAD